MSVSLHQSRGRGVVSLHCVVSRIYEYISAAIQEQGSMVKASFI